MMKLGDDGITFPDTSVQAKAVLANPPAFSAYQSVQQSFAAGINTKAQLGTKDFDTAAAFDSVTNFRFQPLVAGYYQLNWAFQMIGTTSLLTQLRKTGVDVTFGQFASSTSLNPVSTGSALTYLNGSSDYVELWISSSAALSSSGSRAGGNLSGCLLARA